MKPDRIQNPNSVERAVIEAKIAAGYDVILQFDKPSYTPELLRKINNLCGEWGKDIEVRFYGHKFDATNLLFLPDVATLSIDCLIEATNLSNLASLVNLRRLSLGIYKLDDTNILKSLHLENLEKLIIGESWEANFDLAPLQACKNISELYVEKHTKNIDSLAMLPSLKSLTLRSISKKQSLNFVSKIQSLKRLKVILGGRTDISEIQHSFLEELEIIRVMGFCGLDSISAFPSLRSLAVEDQLRLEKIRFTQASQNIQTIRIFNCKNLVYLEGLNFLTNLKLIHIGMTAIEIDSILQQCLPSSLKAFGFYTGKKKENAIARAKLDAHGYQEH
ncbi:MAG TPA: hypothetical protein VHG89_02670 [Verrucomicrobiae bacterium]|nr:hypothetical protein [Verrucomicrobiae bacterium]